MTAEPTVFLIDDDAAVRDSLKALLSSVGLPVKTFACAEDYLAAMDPDAPGCIVVDVRMPGSGGLGLQRRLVEMGVETPMIFITAYAEVPAAVGAMKNGAVDFLEKPCSNELLLERIREAFERDARRRAERKARDEARSRVAGLSRREREVLDLILAGRRTKQIAAELFRTEKTIEFHRRNIMRKTGAKSVVELARLAEAARELSAQAPPPVPPEPVVTTVVGNGARQTSRA